MSSVIFQWLERIGLSYAVPTFKAMGITSPQALMQLTLDDYDSVGVIEINDRRRLFELVHRVRKAANKPRTPGSPSPAGGAPAPEPPREGPTSAAAIRQQIINVFATKDYSPALVEKFISTVLLKDTAVLATLMHDPDALVKRFVEWTQAEGLDVNENESDSIVEEDMEDEAMDRSMSATPGKTRSNQHEELDEVDTSMNGPSPGPVRPQQAAPASERPATADPRSGGAPVPGFAMDSMRPSTAQPERPQWGDRNGGGGGRGGVEASPGILSPDDDEDVPKIRVVVRKRPMNRKEVKRNDLDIIEYVDPHTLVVHENKQKVDLTKYVEKHEFMFDNVFAEKATTEDIYVTCARPMIRTVFAGGNATCFAYGQTGSGKTFTMMGCGDRRSPGMYMLAAQDIFRGVDSREHGQLSVCVSFYEIYGGKLFDLLNDRKPLRALVDQQQAVCIVGLSEQKVNNVKALLNIIDYGNSVRSTGSTGANADSSRSHAVLQIMLRETKSMKRRGKFSFIDLAGSERGADTTHNDRKTRLEGAEINKSLLALKECIRSLYQEHDHTPFRGSKLTQVLKDSFVGNSRTVMIANVSPNMTNCEHTLNTLRYAYRVKEIRRDGEEGLPMPPPKLVKQSSNRRVSAGRPSFGKQADDLDTDSDMEQEAIMHPAQRPVLGAGGKGERKKRMKRRPAGSDGVSSSWDSNRLQRAHSATSASEDSDGSSRSRRGREWESEGDEPFSRSRRRAGRRKETEEQKQDEDVHGIGFRGRRFGGKDTPSAADDVQMAADSLNGDVETEDSDMSFDVDSAIKDDVPMSKPVQETPSASDARIQRGERILVACAKANVPQMMSALKGISAVTQEFERKSCTYEEFLPQIEAYLSAQWSAMNDLKAKLSDFKALVAEEGR